MNIFKAISVDRESLASLNAQLQSQQKQQTQQALPVSTVNCSTLPTTGNSSSASNTPRVSPKHMQSGQDVVVESAGVASASATLKSSASTGIMLQEPDVIASTKLAQSKTTDSITSSGPVAPPRRKRSHGTFPIVPRSIWSSAG